MSDTHIYIHVYIYVCTHASLGGEIMCWPRALETEIRIKFLTLCCLLAACA